jgi:hypothetical protein
MMTSDRDRFERRLKNASEAKQSKLERFQAAANDPERLAERARRVEVAVARKAEQQAKATRLLQEKEEQERQQSEVAQREAEQASLRETALEAEAAEQTAAL